MGSRAPDPTLPFTDVLWLWTDPFPSQSLHPPTPKMKGSEVQVFWTFLKCIKSFQDCDQNWNKPVENASKPCGHRAYLHDVSLPDESLQTPQTVASLCLLTWFHFLCCFPPPCPTPDKVNKASIKTPCLETWLIAAPLCWHTAPVLLYLLRPSLSALRSSVWGFDGKGLGEDTCVVMADP